LSEGEANAKRLFGRDFDRATVLFKTRWNDCSLRGLEICAETLGLDFAESGLRDVIIFIFFFL